MKPTRRVRVIPGQSDVGAVASRGDDIFVVRFNHNQQVEVYDAVTLELRCCIPVPGLGYCCWGLAACGRYKCRTSLTGATTPYTEWSCQVAM